MMNDRMVGKYFRLADGIGIFRVDEYHYNHGEISFGGYILNIKTAEITECAQMKKIDLGEIVSIIELDAIVEQLSLQCGLSFCF